MSRECASRVMRHIIFILSALVRLVRTEGWQSEREHAIGRGEEEEEEEEGGDDKETRSEQEAKKGRSARNNYDP
eukprot:85528-Hanusia_phi.AAC.2